MQRQTCNKFSVSQACRKRLFLQYRPYYQRSTCGELGPCRGKFRELMMQKSISCILRVQMNHFHNNMSSEQQTRILKILTGVRILIQTSQTHYYDSSELHKINCIFKYLKCILRKDNKFENNIKCPEIWPLIAFNERGISTQKYKIMTIACSSAKMVSLGYNNIVQNFCQSHSHPQVNALHSGIVLVIYHICYA